MKREDLLKLFKYYKGEKNNPHEVGTMPFKWWEGEKDFLGRFENDEGFFARVKDSLLEAIEKKEVSGNLIEEKRPIEERTLIFFLDLWNGKTYPNDSLDDIFTY